MFWHPDAKQWWRLWSIQIMLLGAACAGLTAALPLFTDFALAHPFLFLGLMGGLNMVAVGARLLDQKSLHDA